MIELASSAAHGVVSKASAQVDLRVDAGLFTVVRNHVEDFSIGEQSGFLPCRIAQSGGDFILIAGRWMPVPDEQAGAVVNATLNVRLPWELTAPGLRGG